VPGAVGGMSTRNSATGGTAGGATGGSIVVIVAFVLAVGCSLG
jgi:hypothetical protein